MSSEASGFGKEGAGSHDASGHAGSLPWVADWVLRLPSSPIWVGCALAVVSSAVVLVFASRDDASNLLLALFHAIMISYAIVALPLVIVVTRSAFAELVSGGSFEPERLRAAAAGVGCYPKLGLGMVGCLGVGLALLAPILGPGEGHYEISRWSPEVAWHRVASLLSGWFGARFAVAAVIESERISREVREAVDFDLFDLRPIRPVVQVGLRNALIVVGFPSIFALFLFEFGYGALFATLLVATVPLVVLAVALPVRGLRARIRERKEQERERLLEAIRRERTQLEHGAEPGRMADLVSYLGMVDGVREWPFEAATWVRVGLYLLIPVGSWLGGALAERLLDLLLD